MGRTEAAEAEMQAIVVDARRGAVCEMARAERMALEERDFETRRDFFDETKTTLRGDAPKSDGVCLRGDPLAAHKTPVPLLGERRRGW